MKKLTQCSGEELKKILKHFNVKCDRLNWIRLINLVEQLSLYQYIQYDGGRLICLQYDRVQFFYKCHLYTNDGHITFSKLSHSYCYCIGDDPHTVYYCKGKWCGDKRFYANQKLIKEFNKYKYMIEFMTFRDMFIKFYFLNILYDLSIHLFKLYQGPYYIVV